MKKSVSELEGMELAAWVARAQGWKKIFYVDQHSAEDAWEIDGVPTIACHGYRPDINGGQTMELLKKLNIVLTDYPVLQQLSDDNWTIYCCRWGDKVGDYVYGKTPEITICRAVVAAKFGECVVVNDDSAEGTVEVCK